MKKAVAVLGIGTVLAVAVGAVPRAVESATPVSETLKASVRSYNETVLGTGELTYLGQHEITSSLPLVIEKLLVREGDTVEVGDTVATIDRNSSAALIESLGQVSALAISAADLSTAVALLPEKITADCSGRVISAANSGQAVQSGYSIATVAQTEELAVTAAISELDIAKVAVGQDVRFGLAAYPDEVFFGKVSSISQAARSQYNGAVLETVVDVAITPNVPDERLKSGLSAEVEILLSEPRSICVLPYSAIAQDDSGEYVYVYENGKAVRRGIFTGAEFADGTEITVGITADDIVFQDPLEIADRNYIRVAETRNLST
ncbi:MAG: HlyD family efflux transporter periplasmic adaptor subunit [Ruminococcaceae bacterium]|nr:HlyD family efflux transporter periplasmic adaptor subunit [Oscillospiraceae bacterium]